MSDDPGEHSSGRPDWDSRDAFIADTSTLREYAALCDEQADAVGDVGAFVEREGPLPAQTWEGWLGLLLRIDPAAMNSLGTAYDEACHATANRFAYYAAYLHTAASGLRNTADDFEDTDATNATVLGLAGDERR